MEQHKIDRLNELARKHKAQGLSEEEFDEREVLRREYIDSVKSSLRGHLDRTYFVDENGGKSKLRKKGEQ